MQSLCFFTLLLGLVSVAAVPLNRADNRCPSPVVSGNGNFTSPYYSQTNYDNGDFCTYQFNTVVSGYRVVIKCLDFDTTPRTDYLAIFDSQTNSTTAVANISGSLPNPNLGYASSGQYMFAQFSANSDRTGRGFLCAHRTWRECQAQRTFNADQGTVSSPYYNDDFYPYYFSNINCDYNINVPGSSNVVGFTIANFSIGPTETLTLYDGPDANAQMIYSIQGADSINYPKTFRTNFGNQLYVLFQSGTDNPPSGPVYGGWVANFDTRLSCSQTYNDVNGGTITSPDYDGLTNYSPMLNCTSTVDYSSIAGQGTRVVVSFTFTRFALQAGDVVTLYDGRNPLTDPVLAVLTGNHDGDTYYSTQPYMTWTMTSDINMEDVGFTANHAVSSTCNVNYNVSASSLASANFPQNYPNNANCMYTIQLPDPNTFAAVTFDFFDTELCCDYIVIFDGIGGAPLYQLQGTSPQGNTYCASTNSMQIQFVSDGAINRKGFHGNFIAKTNMNGCAAKQAGPPPKVPKEAY